MTPPGGLRGSRGRPGDSGVKREVSGVQGGPGDAQVSQGVKRGVRGVPGVKGGVQVSRGS